MKCEKQTNPFKPQPVQNISKRSLYCEMYEGSKCWAENSFCHYMWRILTEKSILLVYIYTETEKRDTNKTHDRQNSVSGMICQLKRKRIIVCFFRLFLISTSFSLYKGQFIHITFGRIFTIQPKVAGRVKIFDSEYHSFTLCLILQCSPHLCQ